MRKLLRADLSRLLKNKLFWFLTLCLLVWSAVSSYDNACNLINNPGPYSDIVIGMGIAVPESFCFDGGPIVLVIIPVFASMFLGTEFSDGTMRNKIVVGSKRKNIYLSHLITTGAASLVFCAMWHIGALSALPVLGVWKIGVLTWALMVIKSALFVFAFASVLCLISHIVANKAAVAVFEIVFALVVLMAGSMLYNMLLEPEMISGGVTISANENGETVMQPIEPHPNPDYVAEPERSVLKKALNTLPSGQAILLANITSSNEEQLDLPIYSYCASCAIILVSTAAGIFIFKRKDLK